MTEETNLDYLEAVVAVPGVRNNWPDMIINELLQSKFPRLKFSTEYVVKRFGLTPPRLDNIQNAIKERIAWRTAQGENVPLQIFSRDRGKTVYVARLDLSELSKDETDTIVSYSYRPVLGIRITNSFEHFLKELVYLYNKHEGQAWSKSDIGRLMLEIAAPIISEQFEQKYGLKVTPP